MLGTANRDALYAAVKIGLNAASKYGLNGDDLIQKAISVAAMYLNQHRIPVSTALLNEAIQAEQQKRSDRKAEFGTFANPLPDSAVLGYSSPIAPYEAATVALNANVIGSSKATQVEYDRIANEAFASAYEASYQSFRDQLPKPSNQNNNDNDKPR